MRFTHLSTNTPFIWFLLYVSSLQFLSFCPFSWKVFSPRLETTVLFLFFLPLLPLLLLLAHSPKSCIPPPLQRVDANWICSSCASNLFPSCSNALYNPHVCKPYNGPLSGSVYKGAEFIKGTSTPTWYSTQAHFFLPKGQTTCAFRCLQ